MILLVCYFFIFLLPSGLCHVGCACMAGKKKDNKRSFVCVLGGEFFWGFVTFFMPPKLSPCVRVLCLFFSSLSLSLSFSLSLSPLLFPYEFYHTRLKSSRYGSNLQLKLVNPVGTGTIHVLVSNKVTRYKVHYAKHLFISCFKF